MKKTQMLFGVGSVMMLAAGLTLGAQRQQGPYVRMTGTYQLENSRGDDPRRAADAATRALPQDRRDRAYQNLLSRLESPQALAIDRRGQTVTISSSSAPRASFDADGQTRREPGPNGRTISTRAEINGDRLSVSTTGDRGTDFSVTFEAMNNGDRLRVTRRLDSEDLRQPVTVQSYYQRVANDARWDLSSAPQSYAPPRPTAPMAVPDGMRLVATLDTPLSTRSSRSDEQFTMTVRSPAQFAGARIDGVVSRINPDPQGNRANIVVDFDTIQFRGGPAVEFRGMLDAVRTPDGATVRVGAENGIHDAGASDDTRIEHGAVGAAVGAIIGAIAGGGKGAAVGAVVGGAGGAILVDGHDQLDLPPGTEMTITASAPRYR
jgi:hypothetical protein